MQNIYGIILSGGTGSRFQSSEPKQFAKLKGKPLLIHSLEKFLECNLFKEIVVVANEIYLQKTKEGISHLLRHSDKIITGGETRHQSFLKGLNEIRFGTNDIIVVHDAARPFFTFKEIITLIQFANEHGSASLAEKVTETLVESENNQVKNILNREIIYSIKTPQAIHTSLLGKLLKITPTKEPTDLCSWAKEIDHKTYLVSSNPYNIKITYETDLKKAEALFENFERYLNS